MTVTEMISLFDLVQDKVDTIYFSDAEKLEFLNSAQRMLVEGIVFSNNSTLDENKKVDSLLSTIIERDVQVDFASGQYGPTSAEITTATSDVVLYIMSATRENKTTGNNIISTWVRENEVRPFGENTFKVSSEDNPWVQLEAGGLKFTPLPDAQSPSDEKTLISYVREPVDIDTSPSVDCELPEATHENIVAKALAIAGIASGDEALIMFSQLTGK